MKYTSEQLEEYFWELTESWDWKDLCNLLLSYITDKQLKQIIKTLERDTEEDD